MYSQQLGFPEKQCPFCKFLAFDAGLMQNEQFSFLFLPVVSLVGPCAPVFDGMQRGVHPQFAGIYPPTDGAYPQFAGDYPGIGS